jgi:hypothetical protein
LVTHQTAAKHQATVYCCAVQLEDILGNINGEIVAFGHDDLHVGVEVQDV